MGRTSTHSAVIGARFAAIGALKNRAEMRADYGLLAAFIEGPGANVFIRLVAPAAPIERR